MLYRSAIIGCGKIASKFADDPLVKGIYTHAGAYAACQATELVAVCDHHLEAAQVCAKRWDVAAVYTDHKQMLNDCLPEIVSVCTPDDTHAKVIRAIFDTASVKAVFIEKPLATNLDEARELVRLAKEKNIILLVNYTRRYSKGHLKAKEFIEAGLLGDIQGLTGYYTKGLLHNGTHFLDLARWLAGEIDSIKFIDTDDNASSPSLKSLQVCFSSGVSGYLQELDASSYSLFEMDVLGSLGRVKFLESGHRIELYQVAPSEYYSGYQSLKKVDEIAGGFEDAMCRALSDIIQCIEEPSKRPICSGDDGLAVLELVSDVYQSIDMNLALLEAS